MNHELLVFHMFRTNAPPSAQKTDVRSVAAEHLHIEIGEAFSFVALFTLGLVEMCCRYAVRMWGLMFHWIGLRENLQETMVFTIKYRGFL